MRTRLLLVLFLLSAAAVAGFAWPLLESTAASRTQELLISRTAELDRFAALAQQADDTGDTQQLALEIRAYSELYGESVLVVDTRKRQVVATGGVRAEDVLPLIDSALRNQAGPKPPELRPWSSGNLLLARPVGAGTRVAGAVVLKASVAVAASDVAHDWLLIVVGALVAALLFALLALVVSRWVLRPLAQLERGVLAIAAGEERTHVPARAGPRELRALGASFNKMSDAVAEAAEQQRRLVADASHQLRNPMAALRLRVDSLAGQVKPDGMRTYNGCVAEVERMESLLDGLLALATADNADYRHSEEDTCDAATVLVERHDAWHTAADRAGVALRLSSVDHFIVVMPDNELGQVLDVLLDNAVKYAGGGARVDLACADGTITVSDNGPGLPPEDLALATQRFWRSSQAGAGGTGLGLAIAERLVSSRDGEMLVAAAEPHGLAVRITLPLESP
ncbi:sensor histidine kinase [Kibdelosporangium phytohabitans]|uniref:histidine kinase n=1 Tax=Kibdelosporangium phytohabitans TaxID=860235 RepID=A0A0N9HYV7_9PSEU|nr:HAMP domain-containing sensor histidine kinase [Kibdelosporangium phytohabitans]ALG08921.1 histidine kinase [Kibdelosporangium phytohabitans]MBE1469918.1 signal transduction histidine kinase [Kibdelosporangium phytohabitans]